MKQIIIKVFSLLFQSISTVLCKLHIIRPKIIIYMDGGICSQMLMYLHGRYYAEQGMNVYYDIHWFDVCGKDQFGKMPRTFELLEMWPGLEFRTVSRLQRKFYLIFFRAKKHNADWLPEPASVNHSLYLYEYWDLPWSDRFRLFAKFFNVKNAAIPKQKVTSATENRVGVHVRRGDLAKGDNPAYGGVSEQYFNHAIEFCNSHFSPNEFVFFSDEPDWVEQNIGRNMTCPYKVMRGNKAWEDVWYLAQYPIIIASQGTAGKFAALMNPDSILIQCDTEFAVRNRDNSYFIS